MGKTVKIIFAATAATVLALLLLYFVGSGFGKVSFACIYDYSVSEDGSEITLHAGAASSAGYIRKAAVHQQYGGKLYIDFYSAFGGINGSIGAKSAFTLPLEEDTEIIAVYRGADSYQEVLYKDADGIWQMTQ